MHLSKTGAAERLGLELGEQLAEACAELLLDCLFDDGEGKRSDVVLEVLELPDLRLAKEIRTRREHLPELDVRRPEIHEALPEPSCPLDDAVPVAGGMLLGILGGEPLDPLALREILQPIAREEADRRGETRQISGRQEHADGESIFRSGCEACSGAAILFP